MNVRVYMRVGDARRVSSTNEDFKVAASTKPDQRPLQVGDRVIPTSMFALDLDIDPDAFKLAEHVTAELVVGLNDVKVAADIGEIER